MKKSYVDYIRYKNQLANGNPVLAKKQLELAKSLKALMLKPLSPHCAPPLAPIHTSKRIFTGISSLGSPVAPEASFQLKELESLPNLAGKKLDWRVN